MENPAVPNKVTKIIAREAEKLSAMTYTGKGHPPKGKISIAQFGIALKNLKKTAAKMVGTAALALFGFTTQAQITTQTANAPVSAGQKRSVMQSGTCSITSYNFQSGDFVYPVYVSTGGKAFIIKVAKSGRVYRSYPKSIQFVAGEWLAYKVD